MTKVLQFVAAYMGFLWRGARYRIVDSEVSTSFSNASLTVESQAMRLLFTNDRGQLFLYLQPVQLDPSKNANWHHLYDVRRLLTGGPGGSSLLDESYAQFVEEHLGEIEAMFSPEQWSTTLKQLKTLSRVISKEMFR